MNKNVIITGFEPFGGEKINPSWECVRELPEKIGRFTIYKTLLPVEYGRAAELVIEKADSLLQNPDKLKEYTDNAKKMAIIDANERIYSVIRSVLGHI